MAPTKLTPLPWIIAPDQAQWSAMHNTAMRS